MKALTRYIKHFYLVLTGQKNSWFTSKEKILAQLNEPRPLPMGRSEFEEWSTRIISGALIEATAESQKFALAEMIMHIKPTEDHASDSFFIKSLRKGAANQIAHAMMTEIRDAAKARLAAEEAAKKPKLVENHSEPTTNEQKILADKSV